ncbi:MAG: phosphotransferase [Acidimicrobiales bacterium]
MTHSTCDPWTDEILATVARAATASPATVVTSSSEPLGHRVENLTTARLDRLQLTLDDGTAVTVVAKTLRPASAAPAFAFIPPEHHRQVLEDLHWLDEPDVYRSGLGAALPEPLRMPLVHLVDDTADDLITVWMEDVDDVVPWSLDRYRRTAMALGALAGRWTGPEAADAFGLRTRAIERLFFGKVTFLDLPLQAYDAFWADPHVQAAVDDRHRIDLARLAAAVPALLARLTTLPSGVCHGDATPDNFRQPGDGTVVALDWSYGHVGQIGSDLGQLLVGRFESGAAEIDEIPAIATAILDGFVDGLSAEGSTATLDDVRLAWATHLAVRSVFSALVLDHRPDLEGDARGDLLRRRAAVARFGLDLALDVAGE